MNIKEYSAKEYLGDRPCLNWNAFLLYMHDKGHLKASRKFWSSHFPAKKTCKNLQ